MIRIQCPKCSKKLGVDESLAGKVGICPQCKNKFRIQAAPPPVDEIASSPPDRSEAIAEDEPAPPPRPRRKRVEEEDDLPPERDETERRPSRKRKKKRIKKSSGLPLGLSAFTIGLIGLGVLVLLSLVLSLIWPAVSVVPIALGGLLAVAGWLWFLIVAFQDDMVQGLLCWFVPFYNLYYLITHLEEEKYPFLVQVAGTVVSVLGTFAWVISARHG